MVDQLSLEDILGPFDCEAKSTADKFLAKTKSEAEGMARKKYGKIQIVNIYISDRTLKEIMELD